MRRKPGATRRSLVRPQGSWIDRHAKPSEATRKDSDWMHTRRLRISKEDKRALLRQLQYDARFLSGCRVMDYSLLLGIHIVEEDRVFFSPGSPESLPYSLDSIKPHFIEAQARSVLARRLIAWNSSHVHSHPSPPHF